MDPDVWRHKSLEEVTEMLARSFQGRKDHAMDLTVVEEMRLCPPLKDPKFVSDTLVHIRVLSY